MTMAADGTVKPATAMATLVELPPASSNALDGSVSTIRLFQLTLNNITVELSSLGASITKVLLPRTNTANTSTPGLQQSLERDDVVLSYATQNDQYDDGNRPFFGAIVGRVANRIKDVQIETTAVYSQVHIDGNGDDDRCGAKLCLEMRAKLLPGDTKATPISLAQHSYFNLASHSSRSKIFDHTLHLPNCSKFTPLDGTSIPTREVQRVDSAGTMSMDFRKETLVGDALLQYAEESADQDHVDAIVNVQRFMASEESDMSVVVPETGGPFGFDHNYVINQAHLEQQSLRLAAVLSHPPTDRSLSVLTTAPGMQTYTSNYLDGTTPPPALCKDNSRYCRWQGICLETQTYPDSIIACDDDDVGDDEFSRGRCFILRPGGGEYIHAVQYEFRTI
ncbi:hypothetical protein ACHAXH_009734 [Discostella pseudostelligera]